MQPLDPARASAQPKATKHKATAVETATGTCTQSLLAPHYGKQMREHDSAQARKESGHTTNAKKEEIFSDMS